MKESQIRWVRENVTAIRELNDSGNAEPVRSAVFVHIPLPEFRIAYEDLTGEHEVSPGNIPLYNVPNENGDMILTGQLPGFCGAAASAAVLLFYYRTAMRMFGGTTGDLAGWFLQLCELAAAGAIILCSLGMMG